MITRATEEQREEIVKLLKAENLPVDDLPDSMDNFFVATEAGNIVGTIGLEIYNSYGLLRSMVVSKDYRNRDIASQLVKQLEQYAISKGNISMYLLTETASKYFEKKNYKSVGREEVPKEIQGSSEFSHVCPVSAIVMKKNL